MKIRITSPVKGPKVDEKHKIGDVIDVSEEVAKGLFAAQSAERFVEKQEAEPEAEKEKAKGKK